MNSHCLRMHGLVAVSLIGAIITGTLAAAETAPPLGRTYLDAARKFADTVLDRGRDTYGVRKTPLFVDGMTAKGFERRERRERQEHWVTADGPTAGR